jgi:DNA-binding MltR family transcriptional regulator
MATKRPDDEKRTAEQIGAEIIRAMDAEFHHESDRVVAIVGAAYLDSLLDSLLRAVFIDSPEEVDRLLRSDAPLGSNGSRYQLAFCLKLIRRDQREDLKTIAKIRNLFAHDFKSLSFDTPPARDLCANLQQPKLLATMPANIFAARTAQQMSAYVREITTTPRQKFEMAVITLFGSLLRRVNLVSRVDRVAWFSEDPDPGFPVPSEEAARKGGAEPVPPADRSRD